VGLWHGELEKGQIIAPILQKRQSNKTFGMKCLLYKNREFINERVDVDMHDTAHAVAKIKKLVEKIATTCDDVEDDDDEDYFSLTNRDPDE
jgi:hypothetical protein